MQLLQLPTLALAVISLAAASAAATPAYEVRSIRAQTPATLLAADARAWRKARSLAWGPQQYRTQFRALWSEAGLFIRFDAADTQPWSTKEQRDIDLWREEVVEIFLDADLDGSDYIEVGINPGNVVCDVHVHRAANRFDTDWNLAGLLSRVELQLDAEGQVTGWTTTAFFPWAGMGAAADSTSGLQPRVGQRWRFNVFRIERPHGPAAPARDPLLLAWSPTGKPSFHVPEAFREWVLR